VPCGVILTEEADAVADGRQDITKMVGWCTDTLEAFLNMFLTSACFIDEAFFW
jgi:hypothetical protein